MPMKTVLLTFLLVAFTKCYSQPEMLGLSREKMLFFVQSQLPDMVLSHSSGDEHADSVYVFYPKSSSSSSIQTMMVFLDNVRGVVNIHTTHPFKDLYKIVQRMRLLGYEKLNDRGNMAWTKGG